MLTARVGAVTIGQSPRDDVVSELSQRLGGDVEIVQRGALDGAGIDLIMANPPSSGETTLVSRLADGTEVIVEESFIIPRLRNQIRSLELQGIQLILLLCTHKFEDVHTGATVIRPSDALEGIVERANARRLGVFTPSEDQVNAQRIRWRRYASEAVELVATSPYVEGTGIEDVAAMLRRAGVDIAVMDCIGYTETMRTRAQDILNVPVYSAVGALAEAAAEHLQAQHPGEP